MKSRFFAALCVSLGIGACSPKSKDPESFQAPSQSAEASAKKISWDPTLPEGGMTPYKPSEMPPEEIARRKSKNEVSPIIFGLSAGGISMQTTVAEADQILTPPLGLTERRFFDMNLLRNIGLTGGGYLAYSERIAVLWSEARVVTPAVIRVSSGQPGVLSLVEPVGQVHVGDSLLRVFGPLPSEEALRQYLLKLGAAMEKRSSDYNCEQAKTCRLSYLDAGTQSIIDLEFRKGYLRLLSEPSDLRLVEAVFHKDTMLPPRLKESLDYQQKTIGAFSSTSTRAEVESRLGGPIAEDVFGFIYDRGSIFLRKETAPVGGKIKLRALFGFQGSMNFGSVYGNKFLGESFASFAPEGDDGLQLMVNLDRTLEGREPDFDCRLPPSQCQAFIEFDPIYNRNLIVIDLPKAQFRFTLGPDRTWMAFEPK